MYSLGIDIGYSSIKLVLLDEAMHVLEERYIFHKGKVKERLREILLEIMDLYSGQDITWGGVTGSGGKILASCGNITYLNEVSALVEGSRLISSQAQSIIEIGGESAKYITGFKSLEKNGIQIGVNSNCAAGTGAYLEEQMSRLNLKVEAYSDLASKAKTVPRIAGRCSVFSKTDITHHQQEGVAIEDILLGLAYAVVRNYKGTVVKKLPLEKPILFAGGVTYNHGVIRALKDVLKLEENDLIIPDYSRSISAIGVAMTAQKNAGHLNMKELLKRTDEMDDFFEGIDDDIELLPLAPLGSGDANGKHRLRQSPLDSGRQDCFIGVDIGSTSTNFVLMTRDKEVLAYDYIKTLGDPIEAVRQGLGKLKNEFEDKIDVLSVGITGSGRYMIGDLIGADVIKDEITAQAKAAVTIDSEVDTIIEIGGQDSKFICIEDGCVVDFQMNKICAAGTGSFIEEQAKKFDIAIETFGDLALNSNQVIGLGERCTVFMETSIAANVSKGRRLEDIASGLCYAIVRNYLSRVVGQKKIGKKILFQGGVAYNQGVVNAFRAMTNKEIIVPPFFSVTGAYGAALLAEEDYTGNKTKFKGFTVEDKESFMIRQKGHAKSPLASPFNEKVQTMLFKDYTGKWTPSKKTVGIPRSLFTYGLFSMYNRMFEALGFNVLLSEPTSEETVRRGQQYTLDEACYPIKIIMGHVAELIEKKVDYLFFPNLFSVDHETSVSRVNYGCSYMQMAFKIVNQAMSLNDKGIQLLAPTLAANNGDFSMTDSFLQMAKIIGKDQIEITAALEEGKIAAKAFKERITKSKEAALKQIASNEHTFVIISKIYGVADPVLNLGIPEKLTELGYPVLAFYDLPEGDISDTHPNMYWPFGQHILKPAEFIREHSNVYPILLTHHGCGPDSILSHYFKEEMCGKPYLHIEVDEHASDVGVVTRLEAFINSIKQTKSVSAESHMLKRTLDNISIRSDLRELDDNALIYLPNLYPYSEIFKTMLESRGKKVRLLPMSTSTSINKGRKFGLAEEYFSLTALLGDVFTELERQEGQAGKKSVFYLPQNEGSETDGQYSRLLGTKLKEEGFDQTELLSPFMEDILYNDEKSFKNICYGLLAGDLIRNAPRKSRDIFLKTVLDFSQHEQLSMAFLKKLATDIRKEIKRNHFDKRLLAVGEKAVLYNEFLNNKTFDRLEKRGHKIMYASFSEAVALLWQDSSEMIRSQVTDRAKERLLEFEKERSQLHNLLQDESPFEASFKQLVTKADKHIGFYSGGYGRYRQAKVLSARPEIDGIITVSSMYENTGILMNALYKEMSKEACKPLLNLTFDGNDNDQEQMKIESFIYYI